MVGRGTQKAIDVYKILLAELEERIKKGEGAVENEKFRIYWDGMPVWGRLSAHSQLFSALNANVLASTYCNSWIFSALDPQDPFNSMARAYTELFIVRADEAKETYIKDLPEQLQLPLRHAPAPRKADGHSEPDHQRRSARPEDDLR